MIVLKIILAVLGLAFTLFGYFIFFREKYALINGFEEALKTGEKDQAYARRVGLAELILGIVLLAVCAVLIIFA